MRNYFTLDAVKPKSIPGGHDLTFLADVLIDLTLPEHTMSTAAIPLPTAVPSSARTRRSGPAPTSDRRRPTVIIDLVDDGHPQPAEVWALSDDSEVGQVVSPIIMRWLRMRWIKYRQGVELGSPQATYHPSIRGFAQRYSRGLTALCPELGPRVQHRIEGFLRLEDDEFTACYNYLGDPTPEYLQLSRRLDNHPLDDNPSVAGAPGDGQRRRAKARQIDLRAQSS